MSIFILGTDTGMGKTHTAAALLWRYRHRESLRYWKPVQTGSETDDDRELAHSLSGLPSNRFAPTGLTYLAPLSPHLAAELEGREAELSLAKLTSLYKQESAAGPLLVEGAGGLFVPLNRQNTWLDFLTETGLPVVLAARTGLGTINHSLLTLRALQGAKITVVGLIFCGPNNPDNIRTICEFSGVDCLGRFEHRGDGNPSGEELDPAGRLDVYF